MRDEIIVGKFVDRERPDYSELLRHQMTAQLGDDIRGGAGLRMRLTEIRIRRFWRAGRDPVRHHHREGGLHFPGRPRHHDAELRAGVARRRLQRPGDPLGRAPSSTPT